jgi:phenylpropionate dioxygenase-like ring-hydroxylating dioxygenase large terminal subunit
MSEGLFNHPTAVVAGWYWLCRASQLRRGRVKALRLLGRELAVYRGADGQVVALDAYCAHMGAHLAEGRVEGNALRCFFHRWRYEADGRCSDIPCLDGAPPARACVRSWPTAEKHGLIWIWTGEQAPQGVPEPPELAGGDYEWYVANSFEKGCHPNVVLINAIDEQHFRSVHRLPGEILRMEPRVQSEATIDCELRPRFSAPVPDVCAAPERRRPHDRPGGHLHAAAGRRVRLAVQSFPATDHGAGSALLRARRHPGVQHHTLPAG